MILNILAFLMILLLIWKEKFRNQKMIALVILTILVRIGHGYYYGELSMKVEPLIHLQVKYGFEYRDMEIIETQKSTSDFLVPGNNRSARIKYNNNNQEIITVYYSNGQWKDNYQNIVQIKKENAKIYGKFFTIVKKYSNNFKMLEDLQIVDNLSAAKNQYGLIIFLYSENNDINTKIIDELDAYVAEYDSKYLAYGLFIVKKINLYREMQKMDISALSAINTRKHGQTYPGEVLEEMNYQYERITFNHDGYDENIFANNGNSLDDEYKNPNNFEDIIFYYGAERNSVIQSGTVFQVFGINR